MIVIGNLEFMESAKVGATTTYWEKAISIARASNHYMDALPLHCSRHGRTTLVQPHQSIRNASPSGGCHQRCGLRRKCGHSCCLLYTSPSPRDRTRSRMPSSA
eukprot:TRINITY_DN54375_c0_g1_i1.p1 TRINITY_DN54375_c0_g1~~TRINITY_DN54375_c0_g1_i1.p1  ORF type:complete len:103 (+),score=5.21 TRINITY_DN54375_c0_g1_i1:93-401(+)